MVTIRPLQPEDRNVLEALALEADSFGLSDEGGALQPLSPSQADTYLLDSSKVHWVAFDGDRIMGTLVAVKIPLPVFPGVELLVHEIGVRDTARRRGIGSALLHAMEEWMQRNDVGVAWLLADGVGAESFYESLGFFAQSAQPRYMLWNLDRSVPRGDHVEEAV